MTDDTSITHIWDEAARTHAAYSKQPTQEADLRFFALALAGEVGELANFVKKRIRDGEDHTEDLRFECADVLIYTLMVARTLGMTLTDLIETAAHKQAVFVSKMEDRATTEEEQTDE